MLWKFNMNYNYLLVWFLLLFSYRIKAQKCTVEGQMDWPYPLIIPIKDIDAGDTKILQAPNVKAIKSIKGVEERDENYVSAQINEGVFTISLKEEFKKYEEFEIKTFTTIDVEYECFDGDIKQMKIRHDITDTNNHDPFFSSSEKLIIKVYLPIPENLIINPNGDFGAQDFDLTNKNITYSLSENDFFSASSIRASEESKKTYYLALKAKRYIGKFTDKLELNLTAEDVDDTQDPRRHATTNLIIELAEDAPPLPENPSFEKPFYTGKLDATSLELEDIKIVEGVDNELNFTLVGDDAQYFKAIRIENTVKVDIDGPIPEDVLESSSHFLFSLIASMPEMPGTTTTIYVQNSKDDTKLKFEKPSYQGKYENGKFTIDATLTEGFTDKVVFKISGDYIEHFDTKQDGNIFKITVKGSLPDEILEEYTKLILVVEATLTNDYASTTIIIDLPEKGAEPNLPLFFKEKYYDGSISVSNLVTLADITLEDTSIQLITVDFTLIGDESEYFDHEIKDNKLIIKSKNPLPTDLKKSYITLVLEAKKEKFVNGYTAITLSLPESEGVKLKFEKPSYQGQYQDEKFTIDTKLSEGSTEQVKFELSGDSYENFEIMRADSLVTISIKIPLSDESLENYSKLILVLEATLTNDYASTTIIVDLPEKGVPPNTPLLEFKQKHYDGSYTSSDEVTLSDIALDDSTVQLDTVEFNLIGDEAEYFKLEIGPDKLNIKVSKPLTSDILKEKTYIILVLEANKENHVRGNTAITLSLPDTGVPPNTPLLEFKQKHYDGSYTSSDEVTLSDIALDDSTVQLDTVKFNLIGDEAEYFKLEIGPDKLNIKASKPLTSDILKEKTYIILVLEANKENHVRGNTAITLSLPDTGVPPNTPLLEFKQKHYDGSYTSSDEVTLSDIALDDSTVQLDTVKFNLIGDEAEYFKLEIGPDKLNIKVSKPLTSDILKEKTYIILVLEANKENHVRGNTAITLSLPDTGVPPNTPMLEFKQKHYDGSYTSSHEVTLSDIALDDSTVQLDTVKFNLIGDEAEYFKLEIGKDKLNIKVSKPLTSDIVKDKTYINLVLEALKENHVPGNTVITLSLPVTGVPPNTPLLQFKQKHYDGSYTLSNEVTLPDITLEDSTVQLDTVNFDLIGDEAEFFSMEIKKDKLNIKVFKPLPSDTIKDKSYINLILEATKENHKTGNTIITLSLPDSGVPPNTPQLLFEQKHYEGFYTLSNDVSLPDITLANATIELNSVKFELIGNEAEYFKMNIEKDKLNIKVVKPLPSEIIEDKFSIILILEARKENYITGTTAITLSLPDLGDVKPIEFKQQYYDGSYSLGNVISMKVDISLENEDLDPKSVDWKLEGDDSEYLKVETEGKKLLIIPNPELPSSSIATKAYTTVIIRGTHKYYIIRHTIVNLKLPDKDLDITLMFEKALYETKYFYENHTITPVEIFLSEGFDDKVTFEISKEYQEYFTIQKVANGRNKIIVKKQLGEDFLIKDPFISMKFSAYKDANFASTLVLITLVGPGDSNGMLHIIKLCEETSYNSAIFGEEGCTYKLENKWPDNIPDWFSINKDGALSTKIIDREHNSVAYLKVSQVQLELISECSKTKELNGEIKTRSDTDSERYWINTKNVQYSTNKELLNIIIEDVNDNPPIFDTNDPLVVGYPVQKLVSVLRPQSLTCVHATDKDIEENAKIKYSTKNDYFSIHPETGVVYPKEGIFSQSTDAIKFIVSATDLDGKGNKTDLNIEVRSLDKDHIAILTIENGLVENTSDIIATLSQKMDFLLKVISSAVLPEGSSSKQYKLFDGPAENPFLSRTAFNRNLSGDDTSLVLFVYGLDSKNQLLTASFITEQLNKVDNIPWEMDSLSLTQSNLLSDCSTTGLIIGVSILGALLFLVLLGVSLTYFFYIKKNYRRFSNSTSASSDNGSDSDEGSVKSESFTKDSKYDYIDESKMENEQKVNNTRLAQNLGNRFTPESSGNQNYYESIEPNKPKKELLSDQEEDEYGEKKKEKRKSVVTFNENVLQIDFDTCEDEKL